MSSSINSRFGTIYKVGDEVGDILVTSMKARERWENRRQEPPLEAGRDNDCAPSLLSAGAKADLSTIRRTVRNPPAEEMITRGGGLHLLWPSSIKPSKSSRDVWAWRLREASAGARLGGHAAWRAWLWRGSARITLMGGDRRGGRDGAALLGGSRNQFAAHLRSRRY